MSSDAVQRTPAAAPRRAAALPLAAALTTVVLWASAFVGIRSAGRHLSPGALSFGRLLIGSVVLSGIVLVRREGLPGRRDLPEIAICGLLWFGVYNVALNEAERRVDAGTAAMLVNVGPILIVILAGVLLREGFPRTLVAGSAVAVVGSAVIGLATTTGGLDGGVGALLCLLAALAYACGVVAQKRPLRRSSALQVTWLACSIGTVCCLPFAPSLVREAGDAPSSALIWTAYLGVFPTAVAFTTWAYALSRTTAGRLSSVTYLVPPIALLLAWAMLGETPPVVALLGGAVSLTGVAIVRRG